jgi:condensin-2 complex subunit D3
MQQALECLLWPPPLQHQQQRRVESERTTLRAWRTLSRYLSTLDSNAEDTTTTTTNTLADRSEQGGQRRRRRRSTMSGIMSVRDIVEAHSDVRHKEWPQTLVTALCSAMELQSSHNDVDDDIEDATQELPWTQRSPDVYDIVSSPPSTQNLHSSSDADTLRLETALVAATVYAQLLRRPGATAVGLVHMTALSALTSVVQRWKQQVRRVKVHVKLSKSAPRPHTVKDDDHDMDLCHSDSDNDETMNNTSPEQLLVTCGHQLLAAMCGIPTSSLEFVDWKVEAVEALASTLVQAMVTWSALDHGASLNVTDDSSSTIVASLVQAIGDCVLPVSRDGASGSLHCHDKVMNDSKDESGDSDDDQTISTRATRHNRLQKSHDILVTVLRGLHPVLVLNDATLARGEPGKLAAAKMASFMLTCLVQSAQTHCQTTVTTTTGPHRRLTIASSLESNHTQQRGTGSESTVTPQKLTPQRRRHSLSTPQTTSSRGRPTTTTTPKLKAKKPSASQVTTPATTSSENGSNSYRPGLVWSALVGMLQQLMTAHGLEKATVRTVVVDTVRASLPCLPHAERWYCVEFLARLCRSKVPVHRLVAVSLVGHLSTQPWLWKEEEKQSNVPPRDLLEAVHGRLLDKTLSVRIASAQAWFTLFSRLVQTVSSCSTGTEINNNESSSSLLLRQVAEMADEVGRTLKGRVVSDEKASVRRVAGTALVEFFMLGESLTWAAAAAHMEEECAPFDFGGSGWSMMDADVGILGAVCQDASTQTRRTAADGLTRLLEHVVVAVGNHHHRPVQLTLEEAWVANVFPMVLDSETTCVTKAIELAERLVLWPILSDNDTLQADHQAARMACAWRILAAVGTGTTTNGGGGASRGTHQALRVLLAKTMGSAATTNHKAMLRTIHRIASQSLDATLEDNLHQIVGVWCLFDAALGHAEDKVAMYRAVKQTKLNLDFVGRSWKWFLDLYVSTDTPDKFKPALQHTMRNCLAVLSQLAPSIEVARTEEVYHHIKSLVSSFRLPTEIIGPAIVALVAITVATPINATVQDQHSRCAELLRVLYQACDTKIASFNSEFDVLVLSRVLFTVGELSMVGYYAGESSETDKPSVEDLNKANVLVRGLHERPNKQLVEFIQAFMTNDLPGQDDIATPDAVRAHAFVALGKLCLRDAALAKKSLNILARELHDGNRKANWMVQSNSLLVLGDLCVTYTNMVDRFLPVMAGCLQAGVSDMSADALGRSSDSGSSLVRKHAVLLLSSLLLQDYIKWRGLLFHRFLVATVDEDDNVAVVAEMVLNGPLLAKQPRLFLNNFVESLFVLNRCTAHPIYQAAAVMGDGGSGISVGFEGIHLTGELGRVRRMRMYLMMLSRLSDEEKLEVTARIGKEVLGGALKSGTELNAVATASTDPTTVSSQGAFNVLSDALTVLTCPQIRVGKNAHGGDEEDDIEDPNIAVNHNKRGRVALGRLLSKVSRKHLIDTLLPILCQLKSLLESSRSPLLKDLMACLLDVYHRYKEHAQECLANDPTTLQEIEYDAVQHKKALRKSNLSETNNRSLVRS